MYQHSGPWLPLPRTSFPSTCLTCIFQWCRLFLEYSSLPIFVLDWGRCRIADVFQMAVYWAAIVYLNHQKGLLLYCYKNTGLGSWLVHAWGPFSEPNTLQVPNSKYQVYFFFLFIAAPATYENSQVWGWIGAAAAGLHHSHSNTGSKPHLQPMP